MRLYNFLSLSRSPRHIIRGSESIVMPRSSRCAKFIGISVGASLALLGVSLAGSSSVAYAAGTVTPTLTLSSSANPSSAGQSVTFLLTLAGPAGQTAPPSGTVQFAVDGTDLGAPVTPVPFDVPAGAPPGSGATSPAVSTLSPGTHTITATFAGDSTYAAATAPGITQTVNAASQSISFTAPATGTAGGSATLTATGGGSGNPVVFSVDPSSGSGVCTVSGTNGSIVSYAAAGSCVIDANQAGNASYAPAPQVSQTISVGPGLAITTTSLPDGQVGLQYNDALAASGGVGPYAWSVAGGSLPPGLTLGTNGTIGGSPTAGGTFSVMVAVTDSENPPVTVTAPFTIAVSLTVPGESLAQGFTGQAYSQQLPAPGGGVAPFSWSLVYGTFPPGLALSSSGLISGTPTAAGTYQFQVQAADSQSPPATGPGVFTITIGPGPQSISFTAPTTGTAGQPATLTATGGVSGNPVVFSVDPSSGAGVCTVSGTNGTTVNYAAAGSCVIDANQAGNANYTAAPQVTATVTVDQPPAFVMDSPPLTATAGQVYDYTFAASGTPAPSYALGGGAPSWLSVNASTGLVTGTPPTGTTSFTYSVTASNPAGTAIAGPFTVTVAKAVTSADISIAMTCPAGLTVGATGTCTLTVANAGPAPASEVAAAVLLPAALSQVSCTGGCARHGNVYTWTLASLASGASAKFAITVKASKTGTALVLALAASQNADPKPLNNIATALISIKH
jgi:large repetitive protein